MRCLRFAFLAGTALALAAGSAMGATLSLHVNPGLWEITTSTHSSGPPPIPPEMMAQIPPDRRAKMMAMMESRRARSAQPHTQQSCVTQKELDHPFRPMMDNPDAKCSETVASASTTMQDIRIACSGKYPMTGDFRFQAPSPGTMTGHMAMDIKMGPQATHMDSDVSGRWLGSNCGSVKPSSDD